MLLPVEEIGRGGDADGVGLVVVLGVGEDVGAVGGFDEAWVFDAAGPLAGFLGVVGGEEDGLGEAGEVEAVGGGGEAEARGVAADLHGAGVVFGAVEDEDLVVANNGGGVEGVESLPLHGLVGDGVCEGGGGEWGDDGGGERASEGADRLGARCGAEAESQRSETRREGSKHCADHTPDRSTDRVGFQSRLV